MSANAMPSAVREPIRESLRIAGERVDRDRVIEVRHPYDGTLAGTVPKATREDVKRALKIARSFRSPLTRHDRYQILMKAGAIIASKRDELARLTEVDRRQLFGREILNEHAFRDRRVRRRSTPRRGGQPFQAGCRVFARLGLAPEQFVCLGQHQRVRAAELPDLV